MNLIKDTLKELKEFTKNCRESMHEPDEQGISASVVGTTLDNAYNNAVFNDGRSQEFVVILKNDNTGETLNVNLANLIALARKAEF